MSKSVAEVARGTATARTSHVGDKRASRGSDDAANHGAASGACGDAAYDSAAGTTDNGSFDEPRVTCPRTAAKRQGHGGQNDEFLHAVFPLCFR